MRSPFHVIEFMLCRSKTHYITNTAERILQQAFMFKVQLITFSVN
jgi:hypothetical protein